VRRLHKIKIEGAHAAEVPDPVDTFEEMQKKYSLSNVFMKRLNENTCIKPTPV
jgi:hypothetical protein